MAPKSETSGETWRNMSKAEVAKRMATVDPEGYALLARLAKAFNGRAVALECDGLRWTEQRESGRGKS